MNILYYGNGNCSIDAPNVKGVQIEYEGAIEIEDQTPTHFSLIANDQRILIFPNPVPNDQFLSNLFNYEGIFKIKSIIVANNNAEQIQASIKRVMDYSELLNSKAEDMTINSENIASGYVSRRIISKTTYKNPPVMENLNTSKESSTLYLENGEVYNGDFHIHLTNNTIMTGSKHSNDSVILYYKDKTGDELINLSNDTPFPKRNIGANKKMVYKWLKR